MKKIMFLFIIILTFSACNSGSDGDGSASSSELQLDQSVTGSIASEGEVDIYSIAVNDANTILAVSVEGDTVHPEVDLLVTAYEDEVNEDNRLLADHAQEDAYLPADVNMNIYIDSPKTVYIAVRDLMDDEADPEQKYHLTVSTVGSSEENDDFASATSLTVDDSDGVVEKIDYTGDKDCFSFLISQDGVYSVIIEFDPFVGGTSVKPAAELYGPDGELIDSTTSITSSGFVFLTHMAAADEPYHIVVEDSGNDDFDQSSLYTISVVSAVSDEVFTNDTQGEADAMPETAGQIYSVSAALDYAASTESDDHVGDQDWYTIPVEDVTVSGIKVINVTMTDEDSTKDLTYRLSLMGESGDVLFTHDYDGGSSPYSCQVKAGDGTHYILVQTAENDRAEDSEAYAVEVEVIGVQDSYESGEGNNTESYATDITSGSSIEGLIGYRGDVDWYRVSVPTSSAQVLEVYLDSASSMVDYDVQITLNTSTIKRIYDTTGSDAATQLETGIYIDAASSATTDYYIRVADYQGDDGDTVPYTLLVNVVSVPVDAGVAAAPDDEYRYYFSEVEERAMETTRSTDVELEIYSTEQPTFSADTSLLDFRAEDPDALNITRTENEDGTVTITFPWIAGFVDYQGDRDFFQLDLDTLDPDNPDEQWYYDVEIRLATRSETDVEYNWKFYRDSNGNNIIMDNPGSDDGYKACDGDLTLTSEAIDITTPSDSETFYVGDLWTTTTPKYYTVYIGMSDFEYVYLPTSNEDDPLENPDPDDDWGYDAPYYFKVTLTYHPGVSYPE
jgi:hypothetical protein